MLNRWGYFYFNCKKCFYIDIYRFCYLSLLIYLLLIVHMDFVSIVWENLSCHRNYVDPDCLAGVTLLSYRV